MTSEVQGKARLLLQVVAVWDLAEGLGLEKEARLLLQVVAVAL
jgi:hypothetical protein